MRASKALVAVASGLGVLAAGYLGWLWVTGALAYRPPVVGSSATLPAAAGHVWRGAVHVHSELSGDATGTVEQIAAEAARAGLDFVVMADHTRARESAERVRPEWRGDVLLIGAEEISTTAGHLLIVGVRRHRYAFGPSARQALDDVAELGGDAFIAHPAGGELTWSASTTGAHGYEVISYSGQLQRSGWAHRLAAALAYPANAPAAALHVFAAPAPGLDLWDRGTALAGTRLPRPLAALGAVDAHGPLRWLGAPRYATLFGALTMTVWLDSPATAEMAAPQAATRVLRALVGGRSAIVLAAAGEAPGFDFVAERPGGRPVRSGETVVWAPGWRLLASLGSPGEYEIDLLRDGEPVATVSGGPLAYAAQEPGTYRVEVYRTAGPEGGGRRGATPWVASNPIYLWPPSTIAAARLGRAPRLPAPPADSDLLRQPAWAAESDSTSMSSMASNAEGLLWRVRMPDAEVGEPYAAVAWRPEQAVDWSATRGLAVRLRSDDRWRVGLQLRTTDASGNETAWERVVPADPSGRGVGVQWSQFRLLEGSESAVAAAPGRDDLQRVVGVALVVTPARMKTGVETEIEVQAIGPFGVDWPQAR